MRTSKHLMLAALMPVAASAHPGHPALSVEHSHAFFGGDPLYALALVVAGVAGGVAWRLARRRMERAKRP